MANSRNDTRNTLKIVQINLNRSRLAQDMMVQNVSVLNADVVIISEPFRQSDGWYNDVSGDSSVWVTGFAGKFSTQSTPLAAEGVAVAVVGDLAFISCYCSPRKKPAEFGGFLDILEGIVADVRNECRGVVIAGDLNAKSPAWGGKVMDKKGAACMEFLARHGLIPTRLKERSTFTHHYKGSSVIDVMAADRVTARRIIKSAVLEFFLLLGP